MMHTRERGIYVYMGVIVLSYRGMEASDINAALSQLCIVAGDDATRAVRALLVLLVVLPSVPISASV